MADPLNRRTVLRSATAAGGAAVLASCTAAGDLVGGEDKDAPPVAKVTANPPDGEKKVGVLDKIVVSVEEGELDEVTLTNADGKKVKGTLAEDKLSWEAGEELGFGKTYTWTAKATGSDDKPVENKGKFTTVKPKNKVRATLYPGDDAEVGVAMPVSVRFDQPVKDRKAVEKALKVTTSKKVTGSWGWLHDQQVDWRPKSYWPPKTKVKVAAKLYGLHYGGGNYGRADVTTDFTIGRNQVVKVHTPDHKMKVYRDGKLHKSYPSSNGKDADPDLNTPNGKVVVMGKEAKARFDNERYGYTNVWKKWAVRISNHGEFIHENEENRANIGNTNTSHGCVNLFEDDAKEYYDSAMVGDPVEITGAKKGFPKTSDINDWLFTWKQWRGKSAL